MSLFDEPKQVELVSKVKVDETVKELSSAFDYPFTGTSTFVPPTMPTPPEGFGIGLIVGPSGTGKSTILKQFGSEETITWDPELAVCSHFNNAVDAVAYGSGGVPVLRITSSFSTPRVLTATTAGAIEVTTGNTLTLTGAAAAGTLNKIGPGTIALTVTNGSATAWNVNAGVLAVSNSAGAAPLGTNSTTTLNGGTIRITNAGAADYATGNTGTLNINGGGIIALNNTTAFSAQFTFGSITRTGQGTMVIAPTASLGGTTGSRARLIATTNPTNFAGIVSPTIVRLADAAPNQDADFVTYNATNGFITGDRKSVV
jgi:hypothetical protein